TAPGSEARLLAPRSGLDAQGTLASARASGVVRFEGRERRLDHEPVSIEGALQGAWGAADAPILAQPRASATLSGQAERVVAGGEAQDATALGRAATPAALAGLALAAALALALLRGASGWVAYSRIRRDDALENPTRRLVFEHVKANPGVGARAMARALGLAQSVVRHHVVVLEGHAFVTSRRVGARRGYFAAGAPEQTLPPGATRARVEAILASGEACTQKEIAQKLGLSERLVSYHLACLVAEGSVTRAPGRPGRYAL